MFFVISSELWLVTICAYHDLIDVWGIWVTVSVNAHKLFFVMTFPHISLKQAKYKSAKSDSIYLFVTNLEII